VDAPSPRIRTAHQALTHLVSAPGAASVPCMQAHVTEPGAVVAVLEHLRLPSSRPVWCALPQSGGRSDPHVDSDLSGSLTRRAPLALCWSRRSSW
jgi:hypothetical protein